MPDVPDFTVPDLIAPGLSEPASVPCGQPPQDLRRVGSHPDHWYPLAWSKEVKLGATYATHFAGEPVVLVRPTEGPVFALEDRCAHRQVPLSKGVVSGCAVRAGSFGGKRGHQSIPPSRRLLPVRRRPAPRSSVEERGAATLS